MQLSTKEEFRGGVAAFEAHESRDAMYKVATFLMTHFWGKAGDMADGLGVLLLTWNQPFYRYGGFDFQALEQCIALNLPKIDAFRPREISSMPAADEPDINDLFRQFLTALQDEKKRRKSPVAVSKALHLLAPGFFPLWDNRISRACGCYYSFDVPGKYVEFCRLIRAMAIAVNDFVDRKHKTALKLIDEYSYSKQTKGGFSAAVPVTGCTNAAILREASRFEVI